MPWVWSSGEVNGVLSRAMCQLGGLSSRAGRRSGMLVIVGIVLLFHFARGASNGPRERVTEPRKSERYWEYMYVCCRGEGGG